MFKKLKLWHLLKIIGTVWTDLQLTISRSANNLYCRSATADQFEKMVSSTSVESTKWSHIPHLPLLRVLDKLKTLDDKQAMIMTCKHWHQLSTTTSRLWRTYQINASDMSNGATFRRHQKYLKQFRPFVTSLVINGADPAKVFFIKQRIGPFGPRPSNQLEIRATDVVQRFFAVLNMATQAIERGSIRLKSLSMENFENNVSRILSSEYSNITPVSWAEKRKYAKGHTQYPSLFCALLQRIAKSKAYETVRNIVISDTRLENKAMLDLLNALIPHGAELDKLDLANSFCFFHHLLQEQRDRFDWIVYSRINCLSHLRLDHNMLDTELLNGITENWSHCLKRFVIDVRASYRNLRYQFFGRRTEPLEWAMFNRRCTRVDVEVLFGSSGPLSRWRHDIFCDHYENVSTVHVLLRNGVIEWCSIWVYDLFTAKSKCKRIAELSYKRTDFDVLVDNVKRGYTCMSPEYRHAGTYYYSNMTSFTKMLPLKPSLAVTLKRITIDSVDHYNCGVDATDSLEKVLFK